LKEISRIEKADIKKQGLGFICPHARGGDGLLMIPKRIHKRVEKLFIVPKDMEKFMEQLPYGYR
jgi:hypothetical protein